jgi:molybdenum cofactor cytidylyltransferase
MIGVIILAAGSSQRLGRPKQNLKVGNRTLLQLAVRNAMAISEKVVLVLGANYEEIKPTIRSEGLTVLKNEGWAEGLASSVRTGVEYLRDDKRVSGALFMVSDQPLLTIRDLRELVSKADKNPIVASGYKDTIGVPMLFDRKYFAELCKLTGDCGAKYLAKIYHSEVLTIPLPKGSTDIDTEEDFSSFLAQVTGSINLYI